jgi:glycosyltransferase involved in cell wall biosynthesis
MQCLAPNGATLYVSCLRLANQTLGQLNRRHQQLKRKRILHDLEMDDRIGPQFHTPMDQPQVSVVLPVWNGERHLKQAIESILAQLFEDFELIIIDDGSTDGSAGIIRSFLGDPRVRCHRQANKGLVDALNKGIELSKGSFIARIDSDDYAKPERLAAQVKALTENPNVAVIGSAIQVVDGNGNHLREVRYGKSANARIAVACELAHAAVMFKKDVIVMAGGYREAFRHAEDYDLWLRVSEIAEIRNLSEILTTVRELPSGITKSHSAAQNFRASLARIAHRRRTLGTADPFVAARSGLLLSDIPKDISDDEKEIIIFQALAMAMYEGVGVESTLLNNLLSDSWRLRRRLHRGPYVRHCLCPYAFKMFRERCYASGLKWLTRAFVTEPFSACWMLLR